MRGDNMEINATPLVRNTRLLQRRKFVERHLFIEDKQFLIAPNGGTGDCCFKAIAQAIEGTEIHHLKIREDVVDFIIHVRWDKFKESIEVQHIQGNQNLQASWDTNPKDTYRNYMKSPGTLGSSTELNAAGELLHYNFVMIQEYVDDDDKRTYRVENCFQFEDPSAPFYYFYFTGDYDNGHWEYLDPLSGCSSSEQFPDGIYQGSIKTFIDGNETTLEAWLKIHTYCTNNEFRLKHTTARYPARRSSTYAFESDQFRYSQDNTITLEETRFTVSRFHATDLYTVLLSVLFPEANRFDGNLVDRLEDQIINYRLGHTETLNYKLITQPYSHGFDIPALKYLAMVAKGNIFDLLSAADIFGFSFRIYVKLDNIVRPCVFIHVDRWGGETDKMHSFFMRLVSSDKDDNQVIAKWWHIVPAAQQQYPSTNRNNNLSSYDIVEDANITPIGDFDRSVVPIPEHEDKPKPGTPVEVPQFAERQTSSTINNSSVDLAYTIDHNLELGEKKSETKNETDLELDSKTAREKEQSRRRREARKRPKSYNTIVEIFDEETQRRKKYKIRGYKSKAEVFQALYRKKIIKRIPPGFEKEESTEEDDQMSYESIWRTSCTPPGTPPAMIEDINKNVEPLQLKSGRSSMELLVEENIRSRVASESTVALVNEGSINARNTDFQKMHQRASPWEKEKRIAKNNEKSLLERFFGWILSLFSSCRRKKYESTEYQSVYPEQEP